MGVATLHRAASRAPARRREYKAFAWALRLAPAEAGLEAATTAGREYKAFAWALRPEYLGLGTAGRNVANTRPSRGRCDSLVAAGALTENEVVSRIQGLRVGVATARTIQAV